MCTITHPELPTSTPKLSTKVSASRASPVAQWLKNPPASGGDTGWTPGRQIPHSEEQLSPCTPATACALKPGSHSYQTP